MPAKMAVQEAFQRPSFRMLRQGTGTPQVRTRLRKPQRCAPSRGAGFLRGLCAVGVIPGVERVGVDRRLCITHPAHSGSVHSGAATSGKSGRVTLEVSCWCKWGSAQRRQ